MCKEIVFIQRKY